MSGDYPNKPIRLIVPYAPGGATDVAARVLAGVVNKYLPQSVVVENKGGGSGTVGTTELAQSKPDGYTIGIMPSTPLTIQPHLGNVTYGLDDFEPIIRLYNPPQFLFVKSDAPWKTFEEWLEYVRSNPGVFTYGTSGAGDYQHLAMEKLGLEAGLEMKHVAFQSGGQVVTALLGGHIQGATAFPNTAQNEIRLIATIGGKRSAFYSEIPTLLELGFNVKSEAPGGLVAPKGVPDEVKQVLHDAFRKALEDPELIEQFEELKLENYYMNADEYRAYLYESSEEFKDVLKSIGLIQ